MRRAHRALAFACLVGLAGMAPATGYGASGAPTTGPAVAVGKDPLPGHQCPRVHLQYGPPGDNSADARAARDPLFRRILVPGITDNDNGGPHGALVGLADFNHDGRTDILVMRTNQLELFLNQGCWRFTAHQLHITGPRYDGTGNTPAGNEGLAFGDFNGDGNLDIYITRSRTGDSLLLSRGRYDRFSDQAAPMGVANLGTYARGISIGDVNGDGYVDIGVGADQIGSTRDGVPYQRLYVYDPWTRRFNDAGGTSAVPGFGGAPDCNPAHDRDSPGILLRDLAGNGRLDLVQGYHDDMGRTSASAPCTTGERKFGIYTWRNASAGGRTQYRQIRPGSNGLGGVGQMRYDPAIQDYVTITHGLGLSYITAFDAFNTGRLDLIAVGPTDAFFHVNSDQIAGKFFANHGNLRFQDETHQAGLEALNWTYSKFAGFYESKLAADPLLNFVCDAWSNRKPECQKTPFGGLQQYGSSVLAGDFNNDGCIDLIESDRHESETNYGFLRNTLFMNDCHGHFHPVTTYVSGLDTNSETLEAADLTGNGLLDLVAGVQPSNTFNGGTQFLPADRSYTKIYMNTGALGGWSNHWLELQLSGKPERELIGSQLYLYGAADHRLLGRRDLFTTDEYKTAHDLIAHWGLAHLDRVYLRVRLPDDHWRRFAIPCINQRLTLDVATGRVSGCGPLRISARPTLLHAGRRQRVRITVEQPAAPWIAGSARPIPIAGATVSIGARRVLTNAQGEATVSILVRQPGPLTMHVSVPGLPTTALRLRATAPA